MDRTKDACSLPEHRPKRHETTKDVLSDLYIGQILFQCMKKYSKNIMQYMSDTDETETYEEVLTRSIRTALKLKDKGITQNDIISTCSHNQQNSAVPVLATLFLGAKTANFDPGLSPLDATHLLKSIQPKIIFVAPQLLPFMEHCLRESNVETELVVFGCSEKYSQFSEYLEPHPEEENFVPVSLNDNKETSVILFSSGTTGLPKGICLSHYSLLGQSLSHQFLNGEETPKTNALLYSTFYGISTFVFFIRCVTTGSSRVLSSKYDPLNTWRLIEKYKITATFLAPHDATELLLHRDPNINADSLYYLLTGTSYMTEELMTDLKKSLPHTRIAHGYGLTEVAGLVTAFSADKQEDVEMQIRKPLSCGRITQGHEWKVVDPSTEERLGPNQRGELRLKSKFIMNGYYKMDTSAEFDSEGYFKTGDIVYYDEEECFFVVDRIKEMFKHRGWHIIPAVLEVLLMKHPAVKEAVVIGVPHGLDGDQPMGIVVLHKGYDDVTPEDIAKYVNERVTDVQKLWAGVKFVKEFVRTPTDKVKRSAMKQMVLDGLI